MNSGSGDHDQEPYWEEYPIGGVGEVLRTVSGVLIGLLIGLGVTFVLIIGVGLVVESSSGPLADMFDQLARASMVPLLTVTPTAAVLWALSGDIADVATIRAIRRAAERGAPVQAVPHPYQVRVVVEPPLSRLFGVLFFVLVMAGLGVVTMVVMPFTEGHIDDYVPIGFAISLVVGIAAVAGLLGQRAYRRGHTARNAVIATHWHQDMEARAWRRARGVSGGRSPRRRRKNDAGGEGADNGGADDGRRERAAAPGSRRLRRIAGGLDGAALVLLSLSFLILLPALGLRCSAVPGTAGQECHETSYDSSLVETLIVSGFAIFAVGIALAVVLGVVGLVVEVVANRIERSQLEAALEDPHSPRPEDSLLQRHTERRTPLVALLAAALAGTAALLGPALIALGSGRMEDVASLYDDAEVQFAAYVPLGWGTVTAAILLLVLALALTAASGVLGRPMRNTLTRRWPTRPEVKYRSQGEDKPPKPVAATRGPALHTLLREEPTKS